MMSSVAAVLWIGIIAVSADSGRDDDDSDYESAEYETRNVNAQCHVEATEYSGDRLDNPIFEGGGFVGTLTLSDCMDQCDKSTDSHGRSCVAIEWSDEGYVESDSTTKPCALAWGCDYTTYWSEGSVFTIDHGSRNLNAQCNAEGEDEDHPIFEGGGFIGIYRDDILEYTMTLAECKAECTSRTDSKGRPCVAIEWSDGGNAQSESTMKPCALAWGCDYTTSWTGGSVFVRSDGDDGWSPENDWSFAFSERLDFLAEPEQTPWTLTLSGKDLVILVLMAVNVAVLVAVCCVCARSRARGVGKKYQAVRMVGDSEVEEVGLQ